MPRPHWSAGLINETFCFNSRPSYQLDLKHVFGSAPPAPGTARPCTRPTLTPTLTAVERALIQAAPNHWHEYQPSAKRARKCINGWWNGEFGIHFNERMKQHFASQPMDFHNATETRNYSSVRICVVYGLPGSGKSYPLAQAARLTADSISPSVGFMFPLADLRADWKNKIAPPKETQTHQFKTFESLIAPRTLVVEEITRLPPGFIDMHLTYNRNCKYIIILGDPTQARWHGEFKSHTPPLLNNELPEVDHFNPYNSTYLYFTRRLPQIIARAFQIDTLSPIHGDIFVTRMMNYKSDAVLWPSDARLQEGAKAFLRSYTYSSCEGLEFDDITIVVDENAIHRVISDHQVWTAITRAKRSITFTCLFKPTHENWASFINHPFFGRLYGHLAPTPIAALFQKELNGKNLRMAPLLNHVHGGRLPTTGDVLSNWTGQRLENLPPSFRANVNWISDAHVPDPKPREHPDDHDALRTHLPATSHPRNWAETEPIGPREQRELQHHDMMGAQLRDSVKGKARENLATLFPHQTAKGDPTLRPTTFKKRFRHGSPESNAHQFESKAWLGPLLFEKFRKFLSLPQEAPSFDHHLFAMCMIENLAVKLNKPIATIWNNIDRSDPDWDRCAMQDFVKSQIKAKVETSPRTFRLQDDDPSDILFFKMKPGQILVTSPDINILDLGPVARYLRYLVYKYLPDNIYLHGGRTLVSLNSWCLRNARSGLKFTCDFTAYDQSCKAETLAFELVLMDWANIPFDLQDLYFNIKIGMFLDRQSYKIHSSIMRFTGEFCTYDFNTFWNICYMATRYNLQPTERCAFSGDDSLFFFVLKESDTWFFYDRYFSLVGKTNITDVPEFCGWWLTPAGCVRNPILLALRITQYEKLGKLPDVLDNYFLEALFAYEIGDALWQHLPPAALEAQRFVIDYCFKHSRLVPHLHLTKSLFDLPVNSPLILLPRRLLLRLGQEVDLSKYLPYDLPERAWQNQRGKKTLLSLTLVRLCEMT